MNTPSWFLVACVCLAATGCADILGGGDPPPDLSATPWDSIEITYCQGAPPKVEMHKWNSAKADILDGLRSELEWTKLRPLSTSFYSLTNRIVIECGGEHWVLWFSKKNSFVIHRLGDTSNPYSMTTSTRFNDKVVEVIRQHHGGDPHLVYYENVEVINPHPENTPPHEDSK